MCRQEFCRSIIIVFIEKITDKPLLNKDKREKNKTLIAVLVEHTVNKIYHIYRVALKKRPEHSQVLYSSVIDRILKFLHCYIHR